MVNLKKVIIKTIRITFPSLSLSPSKLLMIRASGIFLNIELFGSIFLMNISYRLNEKINITIARRMRSTIVKISTIISWIFRENKLKLKLMNSLVEIIIR